MIPKVIHYCWFGRGEKSPLMKKCIKSWYKYCPDYEIIEWNEDNFDINCNRFVKQAYECKKWAFVSDYARLWILYSNGGIYLDTDVELMKSFDTLLENDAFVGFERADRLGSGIIGAQKNNNLIKEWMEHYNDLLFINNGKMTNEPNVLYMTELFCKKGLETKDKLQNIAGFAVYPRTYFCPIAVDDQFKYISKDTYAIHHFTSSWRSEEELKKFKKAKRAQIIYTIKTTPQRFIRAVVGDEMVEKIKAKIKN